MSAPRRSLADLRLVPLASLAVVACRPEDFTRVEADPVALLGGLRSYSSPQVVTAALGNPAWKVTEQSGLEPGDTRPPFDIFTVTVSAHRDHGLPGALQLEFFNARLMSTSFFPEDPNAYARALGSFPASSSSRGELRGEHLRVWRVVDHQEKEHFLWGDERLLKQHSRWIRRYALATPDRVDGSPRHAGTALEAVGAPTCAGRAAATAAS